MDNIYTGIELGTDSIKIVVLEKHDSKYYVLSSVSSSSSGIKNGQVVDIKVAASSVREALSQVEEMLGIRVTKVVVAVSPVDCQMDIVVGSSDIIDYNEISGEDVCNVLNDALRGQDFSEYELITAMPISFKIDEEKEVSDPKGFRGSFLESKVVIGTMPKESLYRTLEVLKLSGVEAVDVTFTSTGDYFTIKNKRVDEIVGAIINIGETSTNVSVFNSGIQIKNSLIPVGSRNVDRDISYIFHIEEALSRKLKETFAVSMSSYADNNDMVEVSLDDDSKKEISQVGISKVVEARVREILKLAKNEIKNLTNREIRYIIITGGLSELAGFSYLVDEEFGAIAKVCNISIIGIRHNKYSSALGAVKYFDDKLALRGKSYNMFTGSDIENLVSVQQKVTSNSIIGKVFGHFFDN